MSLSGIAAAQLEEIQLNPDLVPFLTAAPSSQAHPRSSIVPGVATWCRSGLPMFV